MSRGLGCIWFIDDNEADNFLHTHITRKAGICQKSVCFESAVDALAHVHSEEFSIDPEPDLIFLDINLPGMNGWEFLAALEDHEFSAGKPVLIMLSTSLNPDDRSRSLAHGLVDDFLNKPLTQDLLNDVVERYFH